MFSRFETLKTRSEAGFTLTEVLVGLTLLGILAAIAVPMYNSQREKAASAAVKDDIAKIVLAVQSDRYIDGYYKSIPGGHPQVNLSKDVKAMVYSPDGKTACVSAYNLKRPTTTDWKYDLSTQTYERGMCGG